MATVDTARSRREAIFEVRRPLSPVGRAAILGSIAVPALLALGRPHVTALLVTALPVA